MSNAPVVPLANLMAKGARFDVVYDIGAHKGLWSMQMEKFLPKGTRFFLFEANEVWKPQLDATGFPYNIACLSSPYVDDVEFYAPPTSGASYYRENTTWGDEAAPVTMKVRTLDSFNLPDPDLIKIDVQGAEIDILTGAEKAMASALAVQCEIPTFNYNDGAPNAGDYFEFFRDEGFVPTTIIEATTVEDVMIHLDILFVRRTVLGDMKILKFGD